MATEVKEPSASRVRPGNGNDAAKMAFAVSGLLAAFGVASCCALPVALSLLGISAAALVGVGYLAAQYQQELFYAAMACLVAAGFLMLRQRGIGAACAGAATRSSPVLDWSSRLAILLALGLLALTFWIEPPL